MTEPRSEIWIADDDRGIRFVLAEALRDAGLPVREFGDAEEVREALRSASPALLVTDVRMPGEGGLALIAALKAQGVGPVIVMSAFTDVATTAAAYRAGARNRSRTRWRAAPRGARGRNHLLTVFADGACA